MTTRMWDVQAALATLFDTITGPTVFKGARPYSGDAPREFILVGADGGETGNGSDEDGLTSEQTFSDLGPGTWRDETGTIQCAVWVWTGNSDIAVVRARSEDLIGQCSSLIWADRTLSGLLTAPGLAEFTGATSRETQTKVGPVIRTVFTVTYGALITA